ncbi:unnamed protein product [Malus baccata var. baccata]
MEDWLSMPKVELHAHLNGSVRDSTLLELASVLGEKGVIVFSDVEHVIRKNDRSLTEVFRLFDLIHILTTDHKVITRITKEVIEDFASENVVYLELRTTPKNNASIGMSKHSYLEAVLEGIKAVTAVDVAFRPQSSDVGSQKNSSLINHTCSGSARKKIYVRLLLSIDRRETNEAAMETVKLALEMRDFGVVGIDLSGNPIVGEWYLITILSLLQKTVSFNPTVVPNPKEIQAMLDFQPQRIGHACCFEEDEWKTLKSLSIPLICIMQNILWSSAQMIPGCSLLVFPRSTTSLLLRLL